MRSSSSALFCHAENGYTRVRRLAVAYLAFSALFSFPAFAAAAAPEESPRELYNHITALRIDPAAVYQISAANRIELRRADLLLSFDSGKLAFFELLNGQVTGVVFSGRGHAVATPRGLVEKQQMARFLGAPLLDQDFTSAYLRFSDDTAVELLRQLHNAQVTPDGDTEFAGQWNSMLAATNPVYSLRLVFNALTQHPQPFVYAVIDGVAAGPFDFVLDPGRDEPVLLGQLRKSPGGTFYDIWASYKIPAAVPSPPAFRALRYVIETSILPDASLEAQTRVRLRAESSGERLLVFQLSRRLNVSEVISDNGRRLDFFQNEGMTFRERSTRGNDRLYVLLPEAPPQNSEFTLSFRYKGNVIEDAGNDVLFVGAREIWYPHLGDAADFAEYDLTLRWPRHLRVVATGTKIEEYDQGEFRVGHWRTEKPVSVAGFNVGEYASASLNAGSHVIDVYANRQLEQALNQRLNPPEVPASPLNVPFGPEGTRAGNMMQVRPMPPHPSDALKQLAREIESSISFYETFSGPFPFHGLSVSQIPGSFGQGWPGLLYLSTFSYLPPAAQQRAGLNEFAQEHFTDLVPFHEVAHQWWGNVVGWSSYRDQWIDEAISNYLALLFATSRKGADHPLNVWLARYRKQLLDKDRDSDLPGAEIGALDLGNRLSSSKSPNGFEQIMYSKGTWVIHMLREMLRQPAAKDPDARFLALLHTLSTKYAYRALSTADLQREIEAVMTPNMDLEGARSMDWFFEEWVRGTGVPRYRVEFTAHPTEKGYSIRGKLIQDGVPHSFIAPVPLFASAGAGHAAHLGTVITEGRETSFRFTAPFRPAKLLIDPHATLLCVTE